MGLATWENAPNGKIVKTDVSIAKNYLSADELELTLDTTDLSPQKSAQKILEHVYKMLNL